MWHLPQAQTGPVLLRWEKEGQYEKTHKTSSVNALPRTEIALSFMSLFFPAFPENFQLAEGDLLKMPAALGADVTPYSSKGFEVEPQFKAMLHAEGVPEVPRLKLAEMKINSTLFSRSWARIRPPLRPR